MKFLAAAAVVLMLGALAPASAEDQPVTKAPPKTMGDEGKLPATGTMGGAVPEMGAVPAEPSSGESTSPKGPPKRMGDEGKLPATGTMGGAVPEMTAPDGGK